MIEKFAPKTKAGKEAEDAMIMGKPAPEKKPDDANGDGVSDEAGPEDMGTDMGEVEDDLGYDDEMSGPTTPEACAESALAKLGIENAKDAAAAVVEALRNDGLLA